jgi:acetyltransferase
MSNRSLAPFLDPASVAVVGASRDPFKVGGSVVANLRSAGFRGRIIPVNSRADTVQGLPAVPSLLNVEGAVDLAVIAVPAASVLPVLKECVSKGIGGAVVISAGFRETGGDGVRREAELREWMRGQPIRVLGPNCLGWIRPARRLNVTFAPGMPEPGGIAFITHSGALAVAILDWARDHRVGFSLFASLGNQADVNESDLLEATAADPETRVIACYLRDGRPRRHLRRDLP